jgi:hypothetical protein
MARPNGFSMVLDTVARPRMCDICTSQQDRHWVQSFVGEIPQSDQCLSCTGDSTVIGLQNLALLDPDVQEQVMVEVRKLVAPDRMAAARAAKAAKREAVAV